MNATDQFLAGAGLPCPPAPVAYLRLYAILGNGSTLGAPVKNVFMVAARAVAIRALFMVFELWIRFR